MTTPDYLIDDKDRRERASASKDKFTVIMTVRGN
jgi:hypothetical protein